MKKLSLAVFAGVAFTIFLGLFITGRALLETRSMLRAGMDDWTIWQKVGVPWLIRSVCISVGVFFGGLLGLFLARNADGQSVYQRPRVSVNPMPKLWVLFLVAMLSLGLLGLYEMVRRLLTVKSMLRAGEDDWTIWWTVGAPWFIESFGIASIVFAAGLVMVLRADSAQKRRSGF